MKNPRFEQKLQEWAAQTASFYHEIAISHDLAFYTQSDLNKVSENPELLILGINPGSGGNYVAHQIEADTWKKWGINGRMDGATLLKGNPCFYNKDQWRIWQGLKRVLSYGAMSDILSDESKYAWSNIIFINTPKEKDISRELFQTCPNKTLELIKILNPKRILCLSIRKCFDVLGSEIKDHEVLIDSYLEKGKLLNIPIYGIRHTSYGNIGEKTVGKCLKYLFDRESQELVSKDEFLETFMIDIQEIKMKRKKSSKEEVAKIVELCVKEIEKQWQLHDIKHNRFGIANDNLSLTVTHTENGYIGIRYISGDGKTDKNKSKIEEVLKKYNFCPPLIKKGEIIWLGTKMFKDFGGSNPYEISQGIISELEEVISELDKIYS